MCILTKITDMGVVTIQAVSVKDFLIDVPAAPVARKRNVLKKDPVFTLVLQNNTDFVVNRKTTTTDRTLACIVSQGLFYVKNNKNDTVEPLCLKNYRSFFTPVYDDRIDYLTEVRWWRGSPRDEEQLVMKLITNPTMQKMYQHGIYADKPCKVARWEENFSKNAKLFKYCYDICESSEIHRNRFDLAVAFAMTIEKKINFNNAKYFIDVLAQSGIKFDIDCLPYYNDQDRLLNAMNQYNLEFNRCIEYLLLDLYSQGITTLNRGILNYYIDYLEMQNDMYGKIKEKYPAYLKTEHDIMALKLSNYNRHKSQFLFLENVEKFKYLEFEKGNYVIILPKTAADIVDEGVAQSHCVGSYVDRVVNDETLIMFMRYKDSPDKSLVTIEVRDNAIQQAKGFSNRHVTAREQEFLKEWAKEKSLAYV